LARLLDPGRSSWRRALRKTYPTDGAEIQGDAHRWSLSGVRWPIIGVEWSADSLCLDLKAQHDVVGIPDDDHVAMRTPPPCLGPEVEHVVKKDVGEQW
jgi:hypothetical protein